MALTDNLKVFARTDAGRKRAHNEDSFLHDADLGLFIVAPWIVTNYAYSMRPRQLTLIDCGYAVGGCTVIGIVLALF